MELCIEKPSVSDVAKKPRSAAVKQSRGCGRKSWLEKGAIGLTQELISPLRKQDSFSEYREPRRRKRLRKQVSLSTFQFGIKRHRNGSNGLRVKPNGPALHLEKQETANKVAESTCNLTNFRGNVSSSGNDFPLSQVQKKDHRSLSAGNTGNSAGDGDVAGVERQHSEFFRQKKTNSSSSLKRLAYSLHLKGSDEADSVAPCNNISRSTQVLNRKRKKKFIEVKDIKDSQCCSTHSLTNADGCSVLVTRKKFCTVKGPSAVKQACLPSKDSVQDERDNTSYGEIREDDVENLEHNAARMLCSLFDQGCTALSGDRMTSSSKPVNGCLLLQPTHRKSKGSLAKVARVDGAGRVLRPRKGIGNSLVRKRRHFYEVSPSDLNPFCIVKQRIRVFWPLDKSWYFGQVKEYDPVTRLHYIRYEDRDEEWINLQNERFKLLLFPSEVASKCYTYSKLDLEPSNEEEDEKDMDDNNVDSPMESEPIISWLARSSAHRIKSSTTRNANKQNQAKLTYGYPNRDSELSLSLEPNKSITNNSLKIKASKLFSSHGVHESLALNTGDTKFPFVYKRKRFHKRKDFVSISEQYSVQSSAACSISIGALTERRRLAAELTTVNALRQPRQVTLSLSSPLQFFDKLVCGAYSFWLCHALLLLQYGILVHVWPMIQLEVVFINNDLGSKYVSVEVCLSSAVSLLCLLLKFFHHSAEECKIKELQMPFTSIRVQISGMHGCGRLKFVLFSFCRLKDSKWQHVEEKLKQYPVNMKRLSKVDCTHSNMMNPPDGSGQTIPTSMDLLLSENPSSNSVEDCLETIGYSEDSAPISGRKALECSKEFTYDLSGCSIPNGSRSSLDATSRDDAIEGNVGKGECDTSVNTINVWDEKAEKPAHPAPSLVCSIDKRPTRTANLTVPRTMWQRRGHTSDSPTFCDGSNLWQEDFMRNGFLSGSKKPRTQVSYSFSPRGEELGSKYRRNLCKLQSDKNIKTFLDSLTCKVNVLVTDGSRGWRECDARVLLESDDQSEWRICIKLSGTTKYMHKVHHFLQPGIANRYTHAMMWRGGKDWSLEFTDRTQWSLFKQIHEECYNRNIRAASTKNIPTPGVCLISDFHNGKIEVPFVRGVKYSCQSGTEIDMALDPSHVLYDMDSDDEKWVSVLKKELNDKVDEVFEVTEDLFERVMDKFEKLAYSRECDEFTDNQIEELMTNDGPLEIIKTIHDYWRVKRKKKGLPLIRQLQPALWKHYKQQLEEWESAMSKMRSSSDGCQEGKRLIKKPPMFAFCLRPRGLQVPNKGLKQRSHKKLMLSGYHSAYARERDSSNKIGKKSNEFAAWEENARSIILGYGPSESSGWFRSSSGFSPNDTSMKSGMFPSEDLQTAPSLSNHKIKSREHHWNAGVYDGSISKHSLSDAFQNQRADTDELRLRDASSTAQHTSTMAKLRREKARWLMHKADLAVHRAMIALITAEAIRSSERDSFREH